KLSNKTLQEISENKSIITTGFQKDVRLFLALSDALVFPSYREGFPNAVMQAGAMGLPCIVTNINGCNEIIIHEINGIIIPVKNEMAIFEAMKRIFTDSDLTGKLAKNAREMIVSRYSQSKVWDAILNEYRSLEHV